MKGMTTHSSILACKSPGERSLEGYSPRGRKESDMTEHEPPPYEAYTKLWTNVRREESKRKKERLGDL